MATKKGRRPIDPKERMIQVMVNIKQKNKTKALAEIKVIELKYRY